MRYILISFLALILGISVGTTFAGRAYYLPDTQTQIKLERVAELYVQQPQHIQSKIDTMLDSLPTPTGSRGIGDNNPKEMMIIRKDYAEILKQLIKYEKAEYERDRYTTLVHKRNGWKHTTQGRVEIYGTIYTEKKGVCEHICMSCRIQSGCHGDRSIQDVYYFNTLGADADIWFDEKADHIGKDHSKIELGTLTDPYMPTSGTKYLISQEQVNRAGYVHRKPKFDAQDIEIIKKSSNTGKIVNMSLFKSSVGETSYRGPTDIRYDIEVSYR